MANAAPTSLNIIPTADVLPAGYANLQVQLSGLRIESTYTFRNQFQTQFGFGNQAELGIDPNIPPDEGGMPFNAKWRIFAESARRPALAIGITSVDFNAKLNPYLVSYKSFGVTRLHLGALGEFGQIRPMLGMDTIIRPWFTFQSDYIRGRQDSWSIGILLSTEGGWQLNIAGLVAIDPGSTGGYFATFGWTGPLF